MADDVLGGGICLVPGCDCPELAAVEPLAHGAGNRPTMLATPPALAGFLRTHARELHGAVTGVAALDPDLAERLASGVGALFDLANELDQLTARADYRREVRHG